MDKLFIESDVIVSFFIGDLRTFLESYQGYMRWIKQKKYPNHKFLIVSDVRFFCFIEDYISYNIDLPDFAKASNLTPLSYEAVENGEILTSPELYSKIIEFLSQFYNKEKAVEMWSPRGNSDILKGQEQVFNNVEIEGMVLTKPTVTVMCDPVIKHYVWKELIDNLSVDFQVVVYGLIYKPNSNIILVTDMEDLVKYSKSSLISINTANMYAYIPAVIRSNSYVIGLGDDNLVKIHQKLKIPIGYRTVGTYKDIYGEDIADDARKSIIKFRETDRLRGITDEKLNHII